MEEGEEEDNVMDATASRGLEEGLFGVLFTISREKKTVDKKWALATIFVDFIQMIGFTLNPSYGWAPVIQSFWNVASYFTIQNPIVNLGYPGFLVFFSFFAIILSFSLAICVMVAHHFKTNSFPYVWPIRFVRVAFSIFVSALFISSFKVFLTALSCNNSLGTLRNFQAVQCWSMPHLIVAALGALFALVLSMTALGVALVSFEPNMNSEDLLGSANSKREFQETLLKVLMTAAESLLFESPKVQSILFSITSVLLLVDIIRFVPYYHPWINELRGGLYAIITWCSLVLLSKQFWFTSNSIATINEITWFLLGGIPIAFLGGFWVTRLRLLSLSGARMMERSTAANNRHHDATSEDNQYVVTKPFSSETHVEISLRFLNNSKKYDELFVAAVGGALLDSAVLQYPESPIVHLTYANFILCFHSRGKERAQVFLEKARRMKPSFVDRFCLFLRERERVQNRQAASNGETVMDLVSYIEFQNKYKTALQSYKSTLRSVRSFWRLLLNRDVTLAHLAHAFRAIDRHEETAERTFRSLLENYPKSVTALRGFGRFCENIKADIGLANKYYQEASRQEDMAADARRKRSNGDNNVDSRTVDDKTDATIISNQNGIITFVNNRACKLFGWKKDDLVGRNLNVLMPAPISEQHSSFLKRYLETGRSTLLGTTRAVEGAKKTGEAISIKVTVNRIDNANGISFVGIIREENADGEATVVMNAFGSIQSVTKPILSMFGYATTNELVGKNVQILMNPSINHDAYLKKRRDRGVDGGVDFMSRRLMARRRDGSYFPVQIDIRSSGQTPDSLVFTGNIKAVSDGIAMISMTDAGVISSINRAATEIFGWSESELVSQNVSKLMLPPYSEFHDYWLKDYKSRKSGGPANGSSIVMSSHNSISNNNSGIMNSIMNNNNMNNSSNVYSSSAAGKGKVVGKGRRVSVVHKDGAVFDVILNVSPDVASGSSSKGGYFARVVLCDDRVVEEERVGAIHSGTITLNQELNIVSSTGASAQLFDENDPAALIGRNFSELFVEDVADVEAVGTAGTVVILNKLGETRDRYDDDYNNNGKMTAKRAGGEACIVIDQSSDLVVSGNYKLVLHSLSGLEAVVGIDEQGAINYCNRDATILLGEAKAKGMNIRSFFQDPDRAGLSEAIFRKMLVVQSVSSTAGNNNNNNNNNNSGGTSCVLSSRRTGCIIRTRSTLVGVVIEMCGIVPWTVNSNSSDNNNTNTNNNNNNNNNSGTNSHNNSFSNRPSLQNSRLAIRITCISENSAVTEWLPSMNGPSLSPQDSSPKPRFVRFGDELEKHQKQQQQQQQLQKSPKSMESGRLSVSHSRSQSPNPQPPIKLPSFATSATSEQLTTADVGPRKMLQPGAWGDPSPGHDSDDGESSQGRIQDFRDILHSPKHQDSYSSGSSMPVVVRVNGDQHEALLQIQIPAAAANEMWDLNANPVSRSMSLARRNHRELTESILTDRNRNNVTTMMDAYHGTGTNHQHEEDDDEDYDHHEERGADHHSDRSSSMSGSKTSGSDSSSLQSDGHHNRKYKKAARALRISRIHKRLGILKSRLGMVVLIVLAVHVTSFVFLRTQMDRYVNSTGKMIVAGEAVSNAQRVISLVNQLGILWSSSTLSPSAFIGVQQQLTSLASTIEADVQQLYSDSNELKSTFEGSIMDIARFTVETPPLPVPTRMNLWNSINLFVQQVREIAGFPSLVTQQNAPEVAAALMFVTTNSEVLMSAFSITEDVEWDSWVTGMQTLSMVNGLVMVVEIIVVLVASLFILMPMVNMVFCERKKVYRTFTVIPRGVVMRLATQSIVVEDDEDDDEDASDDGLYLKAEQSQNDRNNGDDDEEKGLFRHHPHRRTGRRNNNDNVNNNNNNSTSQLLPFRPKRTEKLLLILLQIKLVLRYIWHYLSTGEWRPRKTSATSPISSRKETNKTLPDGNDQSRSRFLIIIALISFLLLVALSLSVLYLEKSRTPSSELTTAEKRLYYTLRVHSFAQELIAASSIQSPSPPLIFPRSKNATVSVLIQSIDQVTTLHQQLLDSSLFRNPQQQTLLYNSICLRTDAGKCRLISDPMYPLVHNGLDALLSSFLFEAYSLTLQPPATWNSNNTHFLFVDAVATTDLLDGLQTSIALTRDEARQLAPADVVGQTLIFVFVAVLLTLLHLVAYRPFGNQVLVEARRATIMLSSLPEFVSIRSLQQ